MPSDTLAKLPSQEASQKAPFWWMKVSKTESCKTMKPKLGLVQMKKTVKLLEGMGKSITEFKIYPDGTFHLITSDYPKENGKTAEPNEWD